MYLVQFIRGFCMALADSVPGVSGGTVAFLLGFYDQFIDSIDDLITGSREKKKAALFFLIKLGTGWVCGMILGFLRVCLTLISMQSVPCLSDLLFLPFRLSLGKKRTALRQKNLPFRLC